jgi:hypothetical protein
MIDSAHMQSEEFFAALTGTMCGICYAPIVPTEKPLGGKGYYFVYVWDHDFIPPNCKKDEDSYCQLPMCPGCYGSWGMTSAGNIRSWELWVVSRRKELGLKG